MFHSIFDYNYGNFWKISIIFLPLETRINTLPNMYKLFHFNLTITPFYEVKPKITQKHSYDIIKLLSKYITQNLGVFLCVSICEKV